MSSGRYWSHISRFPKQIRRIFIYFGPRLLPNLIFYFVISKCQSVKTSQFQSFKFPNFTISDFQNFEFQHSRNLGTHTLSNIFKFPESHTYRINIFENDLGFLVFSKSLPNKYRSHSPPICQKPKISQKGHELAENDIGQFRSIKSFFA